MRSTRVGFLVIRASFWVLALVGVVLLVLQLAQAMDAHFTADAVRQLVHSLLIPILPLLVLPTIVNLWILPAAHRHQAYVDAAWRGDAAQPPLADHQPEPDAATRTLPITIRLRPRWHVIFGMDVLFFLIAGLYVIAYGLTDTPPSSQSWLVVFVFAIIALIFVMLLFIERAAGKGFTVSEEGLGMHNLPATPLDMYAIKWSEARLFAIVIGRKKRPGEVVYVLAAPGPGKFVNWPHLCQPTRWYATLEPAVPFAEYDQQIQALLSLIAARTGLPLRVLR